MTCQLDGGTTSPSGTISGNDRPIGFATTDDAFGNVNPFYVEPSTDANGGNTAMRLQTDNFFAFGILGLYAPETLVQETLPVAYPLNYVPVSIDGFYKHSSGTPVTLQPGTCSSNGPLMSQTVFTGGFRVYARMFDAGGNLVATADEVFPDAATYTAFSAPVTVLQPGVLPSTIVFVLSVCPEFESPNAVVIPGSVSFVDDVEFVAPASLPLTWGQVRIETLSNKHNRVVWNTATEQDVQDFTVEFSRDGTRFADVGSVAAKNLPQGATYRFDHSAPVNQSGFYRVRSTDFSGLTNHSPVVRHTARSEISLYPNPVLNELRIQRGSHGTENAVVTIYDRVGRHHLTVRLAPGESITIDVQKLPSGQYFARYLAGGKAQLLRFVK